MKKNYNQPEVTVSHFESMALMQAASPGPVMNMRSDIDTGDQW